MLGLNMNNGKGQGINQPTYPFGCPHTHDDVPGGALFSPFEVL